MFVKKQPSILVDVRAPGTQFRERLPAEVDLRSVLFASPASFSRKRQRSGVFKKAAIVFAAAVFVLSGALFVWLKGVGSSLAREGSAIAGNFSSSVESLKDLDTEGAASYLQKNRERLAKLNTTALKLFGSVVPFAKNAVNVFRSVTALNAEFLRASELIGDLSLNGLQYFLHDGPALIERVNALSESAGTLQEQIISVENAAGSIRDIIPERYDISHFFDKRYVAYSAELGELRRFLSGVSSFLSRPGGARVLLLFQNASEIRPAGGFVGSYGDLTVLDGQMSGLTVQDIYWPDHEKNFDLKLIPPEALQTVTRGLGARDANWFFDFPTSAKVFSRLLESSRIYREDGVTFDAVIGVNTEVLKSLLYIVGPIDVPEYGLKLSSRNVLAELQREVETGKDKKSGENPKKILTFVAPRLLERIGELDESGRNKIVQALSYHIAKKDIMFYAPDESLASFFASRGIDGALYEIPFGFWGSYVAVVNANIAGGKSDAFVDETVQADVEVLSDGGTRTNLSVIRTHRGANESDSWYRADNKNFIQIFTEPSAELFSLEGNEKRALGSSFDYEGAKYEQVPELAAIEETKRELKSENAWEYRAFGKKVFAAWFTVKSGESGELRLRYHTPGGERLRLESGKVFTFIFERQSGVRNSLAVAITAPPGYVWKESGSSVYTFSDPDPDARVIVNLTLASEN